MTQERKRFFIDYIKDGLVDWERALIMKNYIETVLGSRLQDESIDRETYERYESRKISDIQQATEKFSKGLLLIYGGTVIVPFLVLATVKGFAERHPRQMEEVHNEAKDFFMRASWDKAVQDLGHTPISRSGITKLLELTQHLFRRYLHEEALARCYKRAEDFITSGVNRKRWNELWNVLLECEKADLRKYGRYALDFLSRCIGSGTETCGDVDNAVLKAVLDNPYLLNFSLVLTEEYVKEFIDLILVTAYLEPVSSVARYSVSLSLQDERKKEVLRDAIENQDKIMSLLEVKIQMIKNLIESDETVENLAKLYEAVRELK